MVRIIGVAVWLVIGGYAVRFWGIPRFFPNRHRFGQNNVAGIEAAHMTISDAVDGSRTVRGSISNGTDHTIPNLRMYIMFSSADSAHGGGMLIPIKSVAAHDLVPFEVKVPEWTNRYSLSSEVNDY